jgi:(S)-citramalyl-CoA lyase
MDWRSLLFVPGDRADRHAGAFASGADAVCLDLEDAVIPAAKDHARTTVLTLLGSAATDVARMTVRLNDVKTEAGERDLAALGQLGLTPAALILPKVRSLDEVRRVHGLFAGWSLSPPLIPLIETAAGLSRATEIAAGPGVGALLFGGADLSADLGCALEWEPLLYARSRIVHAAAEAGIRAIDMPCLVLDDARRLEDDCRRARSLGFSGKAAIHPAQIPVVHAAFTPSESETDRARRIVSAAASAIEGVVVVDGRMVDAAVVRNARRTLQRAGAARQPRNTDS